MNSVPGIPGKRRGPYRKSAERRHEILDAAVTAFARGGHRGASIREISEMVGMSAPGLLHHFGSKEALLIEVLRHRDELDLGAGYPDGRSGLEALLWLVERMRRNADNRGLVELYCVLSAEAASPDHPAHVYYVQRYEWLRDYTSLAYGALNARGALRPGVRPASAARATIAVMDGLQVQWLLNPVAVDMAEELLAHLRTQVTEEAWRVAGREAGAPGGGPQSVPQGRGAVGSPSALQSHGPEVLPRDGVAGASGEFGAHAVTIQDIARLTGVSTASVSRALNDRPGVSASTRDAVLRVAAEHGFSGNASARALKSGLTGRIAFQVPWVKVEYCGRILEGAARVLRDTGHSLSVITTGVEESELAETVGRLNRTRFDGAIQVLPFGAPERFRELAASGFPLIQVDPAVDLALPFPAVVCDNVSGGRQAAEHLLRLGHREIGVLAGRPEALLATVGRLRGFREALATAGVLVDPAYVRYARMEVEDGFMAATSLLSVPYRPTAVFAFNDRMAAGVLRAAQSLGIDVPGELSVVGFDDQESAALVTPSLTTVRQPLERLGATAARVLLDWIGGTDPGTASRTLPVELVVRGSTAHVSR
ncbi:substrate-binding domain-containing protein [Streptomyces sp. SM11]|uniref:substrate-binding domain-containing protein n=1 Tax=Streptomyces sp. SM11 TaxID=565557 RepID=UPI000CD49C12|nr:substrate-binding domain-containing protein [Streptomyces sp. SM11]